MTSYIISIISCLSYPVPLLPFAPRHISSSLSIWFSTSLIDLHYTLVCLSSSVYLTVCVSTLIASFFHSVVSLTSRSLSFFMSICVSEYLISHLRLSLCLYVPILATFFLCRHLICFHCFVLTVFLIPSFHSPFPLTLILHRYHNDHAVMILIFWWSWLITILTFNASSIVNFYATFHRTLFYSIVSFCEVLHWDNYGHDILLIEIILDLTRLDFISFDFILCDIMYDNMIYACKCLWWHT